MKIDILTRHNGLSILFVNPLAHSKGIRQRRGKIIEGMYPNTEALET